MMSEGETEQCVDADVLEDDEDKIPRDRLEALGTVKISSYTQHTPFTSESNSSLNVLSKPKAHNGSLLFSAKEKAARWRVIAAQYLNATSAHEGVQG